MTASDSGEVRVWDMANGNQLARSWLPSDEVFELAAHGQRYLCLAKYDGEDNVALYSQHAEPNVLDFGADQEKSIYRLSPTGAVVALIVGNQVQLWSPENGSVRRTELPEVIHDAAFSPNGECLLLSSRNADQGTQIVVLSTTRLETLAAATLPISFDSAGVANTGTNLATIDRLGRAAAWDIAAGVKRTPLPHAGRVSSVAFSQDSALLASASEDGIARVWNVANGSPVSPPLRHLAPLTHVLFSPKDALIATASADGTARLWGTRSWEKASCVIDNPIPPRKGHGPALRKVFFHPQGHELVTVAANGMLRFWDISQINYTSDELRNLVRCYGSGETDSLTAAFDQHLKRHPEDSQSSPINTATWQFLQARSAELMSNWAAAAEQYSQLIDLDRSQPNAWLRRAQSHAALQHWSAAVTDFEQSFARGVEDADAKQQHRRCLKMSETTILVPVDSPWRWLHPRDGIDPAAHEPNFHDQFSKMNFDDSGWQSDINDTGPHGGFGYGDDVGINIGLPAQGNRKTAYFRCLFECSEPFEQLILLLQRDDGVIVYLDGEEVVRDNVLDGAETYELLASSNPAFDERSLVRHVIDKKLAAGKHVLAISLHNKSAWSSDLRLAELSLHGLRTTSPAP